MVKILKIMPPSLKTKSENLVPFDAQVRLASLPSVPLNHAELRAAVAGHLKLLPSDRRAAIASTLFRGSTRRLSSLAERQRRSGEYVDDDGVMALATADYLGRNIVVYGFKVRILNGVFWQTRCSRGCSSNTFVIIPTESTPIYFTKMASGTRKCILKHISRHSA